jgi:hypothetical protein
MVRDPRLPLPADHLRRAQQEYDAALDGTIDVGEDERVEAFARLDAAREALDAAEEAVENEALGRRQVT